MTSPCTINALLASLGTLLLVTGVVVIVLWRMSTVTDRVSSRRLIIRILGPALAVALAVGAGSFVASSCRSAAAGCPNPDVLATRNLLSNPQLAAGPAAPGTPDSPLPGWVVSGTLNSQVAAGTVAPAEGSDVYSARVRMQPGAQYCYQTGLGGTGHGQALVLWDDATLKQISYSAQPPQPTGEQVQNVATAPPGAVYARLLLRATDGAPQFRNPALAPLGVQVESWPNGAKAAFAFSFDWESAMGGLIHSKSQHDVAYAVNRGLNMRQGADILLGMFQQANIKATFYATGYNLLDGNTEHRQFVGNPTYKWGPKEGWATTWWLTNTWYSDDPYGTIASDPAWYFSDQTDKLHAAGQEIGSHTFGHLSVRNTKPAQLSADLDEWVKYATARGLPPVRSFAFPWQSSNSLTPDFYRVLAAHGIDSLTRLYPPDLCRNPLVCDRYVIQASPVYSPVLIMPDFQLGASGADLTESGPTVVTDTIHAAAVISETIARGGATSFWNHPEVLTIPAVRDVWQSTVAAVAGARDRGDLWVAPVSDIAHYWRDVAQVAVSTTTSGNRLQIRVANQSPDPLDGLTLSLPQAAQAVRIDGSASPQRRPTQVIVPHLAAGQTVQIEADLAEAPGR